jgi:CheY-like chemotaxis protein
MKKHKILVVDDEENIRILYKLDLEDEGYEVEIASSGEEALEKLKVFPADLVTLDIKMPGIGGIETLHQIKSMPGERRIPVILCTAFEEYKQDFSTWASEAYVVKSHDLTELKNIIKNLLGEA